MRPASDLEDVPSNEKYYNRAAELWFSIKEMIRHGQLWGLQWQPLVAELTTRRHTTQKSAAGNTVVKLEGKKELRKRTGISPDIADSLAILIDTVRERGKFQGNVTFLTNDNRGMAAFEAFVKSRNMVLKSGQRLVSSAQPGAQSGDRPWWAKKQPQMARLQR